MAPEHRDGREPDPHFAPNERLYQRYSADDLIDGRTFNPLRLRFPGQSTVREKYSVPEDVIHPDCCGAKTLVGYSILTMTVEEITNHSYTFKEHTGVRVFELFIVHKPEETCYAHSEIWCNVQGSEKIPTKLPKDAKQAFRAAVARLLTAQISKEIDE